MLVLGTMLGPASAGAQQADPAASDVQQVTRAGSSGFATAEFRVRAAASPIVVDARLDEEAWAGAESIPLPVEIEPGDNTGAVVATDCRVTFDDANLYFGCVAEDPEPRAIRAFMTDRDRIFGNNDRISFLIDPFNDMRRGWVFEVSPLGVQADLVFDERTDNFDATWDAIWSSEGRITETGYVIEAAIPFRSLRFPATSDVQSWRFWINRMRPRNDAYRIMRTNTRLRGEACQLCQAPMLVGLQGIAPGRNVEVAPTVVAVRSDAVPAGGPPSELQAGSVEWEPGIDARWSPTTDLTLNATANPDFSQVEADDARLDANNRFALLFSEKRPFFLEGSDLFQTPMRAVNTRSVADPVAGAKFSGKLGRNGLGLLVTRDRVNNLLLPGAQSSATTSSSEEVSGVMSRFRRDLGGRHTLGALYTARVGDSSYRNHVAGVDAFLQPTSKITLDAQVLGSTTEYAPSTATEHGLRTGSFSGFALDMLGSYNGSAWGYTARVHRFDPGFRADAGFMPQVDVQGAALDARRSFYGDAGDFLTQLDISGGGWSNQTTGGRLIEEGVWLNLRYEGPLQSEAWLNPVGRRERFGAETFDVHSTYLGVTFRPLGKLRLGISGNGGTAIDLRNTREVDELRISPSLDLQIGRRGEVGLSHNWQRLSLDGEDVLIAQAGQLRTIYNFSTRAYLRALVQYRHTERDPETNPDLTQRLSRGVFSSVLFSYKLNPLTVLFVGYTDDRAATEDVLEPTPTREALGLQGRTFFLKLGYAWRP